MEYHKHQFTHIAWLSVKNTVLEAFSQQIALADSLLIEPKIGNKTDRFQYITNVLRQLSGNNLLILDNVKQDVEHNFTYDNIRLADNWNVIVTTEEEDLEDFFLIKIKPFSNNQLIGLFEKHYNKPYEYSSIQQIIQLAQSNTKLVVDIALRANKLRLELPEVIKRIQQNGLDDFLTPKH